MKKNKKIINEVHQMKNLMKYMDGKKVNNKQIKEEFIKEDYNERYRDKINVSVNTYKSKMYSVTDGGIQELRIDDAETEPIYVYFDIEIEKRNWGIDSIDLINITGPSDIDIILNYYKDDDSEEQMEINVKLNWENIKKDYIKSDSNQITIGNTLEVYLVNNDKSDFVVQEMEIEVHGLNKEY